MEGSPRRSGQPPLRACKGGNRTFPVSFVNVNAHSRVAVGQADGTAPPSFISACLSPQAASAPNQDADMSLPSPDDYEEIVKRTAASILIGVYKWRILFSAPPTDPPACVLFRRNRQRMQHARSRRQHSLTYPHRLCPLSKPCSTSWPPIPTSNALLNQSSIASSLGLRLPVPTLPHADVSLCLRTRNRRRTSAGLCWKCSGWAQRSP